MTKPATVSVQPFAAQDLEPLLAFVELHQPGVSEVVNRFIHAPWQTDESPRAIILRRDDEIVGYLTAVECEKPEILGAGRQLALGSWFVEPTVRSHSLRLMQRAVSRRDICTVTHTPNTISQAILGRFGFTQLDTSLVLLPPFFQSHTLLRMGWAFRPIEECTDPELRDVAAVHAQCRCGVLLLTQGDRQSLLISKRRTLRGLPVSELLFASDLELTWHFIEQVKLAVMRSDRRFGLMLDERLLEGRRPLALRRSRVRLWRGTQDVHSRPMDNLFSEIAVL